MDAGEKSIRIVHNNQHDDTLEKLNPKEDINGDMEVENGLLSEGSKNGTSENARKKSEFDTYGVTLLISCFFLRSIIMGLVGSAGIITRVLLDSLDAGQGELNWIGSICTGSMMLFGPLAGSIETRYDARKLAVLGGILSTVGVACSFFVNTYYFLYITYGVFGGCGLAFLLMTSAVPLALHFKTKRTLANGIANMGGGVGVTVMPMIITFLDETYGWRGMFLILSGIFFQTLVFSMMVTPDYKEEVSSPTMSRRRSSVAKDSLEIYSNRNFWMFSGAALLSNMVVSVPYYLLPVKAASAGLSPTEQAAIFTTIGIVNIIHRPLFGIFMDRLQKYTICTQGISIILLMLCTFWLPYIYDKPSFYIYGVIVGLTHGSYLMLQPLSVLDVVTKRLYSLGLGHFRLMIFAGVVTGAPLAGWLVDIRGKYDWACFYGSSVGITGGLLLCVVQFFFLRQQKRLSRKPTAIELTVNLTETEKH